MTAVLSLPERPTAIRQRDYDDKKQYRRDYMQERLRIYREWIQDYKVTHGCVDCGYNAHPHALEFDHIPERGKKKFLISHGAGRKIEKVLAEIAKCDLVCANCHRVRTAQRGEESGWSGYGRARIEEEVY